MTRRTRRPVAERREAPVLRRRRPRPALPYQAGGTRPASVSRATQGSLKPRPRGIVWRKPGTRRR